MKTGAGTGVVGAEVADAIARGATGSGDRLGKRFELGRAVLALCHGLRLSLWREPRLVELHEALEIALGLVGKQPDLVLLAIPHLRGRIPRGCHWDSVLQDLVDRLQRCALGESRRGPSGMDVPGIAN